jgi:murein DD-endopeptidase MepM/ murein hydrolase activator NlpD
VLPILTAIGGYYFGTNYKPRVVQVAPPDYGQFIEQAIREQREMVGSTKTKVENHLDALGRNLGRLHAQVARINALGLRLTEMTGLDPSEFSFGSDPALGGPDASDSRSQSVQTDLIETLDSLAAQLDDKYDELNVVQRLLADRSFYDRQFPSGWPMPGGWISSSYGYRADPFSGRREFHAGVDIAGKPKTPIKVVAAGIVTHAGVKGNYGLMVEVNHGDGYATRYGHAMAVLVQVGQRVEKDQIVAIVGSSGRSTGPHVHFEVLRDGKMVNPRRYLKASR